MSCKEPVIFCNLDGAKQIIVHKSVCRGRFDDFHFSHVFSFSFPPLPSGSTIEYGIEQRKEEESSCHCGIVFLVMLQSKPRSSVARRAVVSALGSLVREHSSSTFYVCPEGILAE